MPAALLNLKLTRSPSHKARPTFSTPFPSHQFSLSPAFTIPPVPSLPAVRRVLPGMVRFDGPLTTVSRFCSRPTPVLHSRLCSSQLTFVLFLGWRKGGKFVMHCSTLRLCVWDSIKA